MSTVYRFLQPLDVLFLRGNHLFGDAGQHGAALMPPWPSVAAGALRSRMLADGSVDFEAFKSGQKPAGILGEVLGTPAAPGRFELAGLWLARQGRGKTECFFPAPADVVMLEGQLHGLRPRLMPLPSSAGLPMVPVLQTDKAAKPQDGWMLNEAGWKAWLKGEPLETAIHAAQAKSLYAMDERLGIALDRSSRTAADGALYTAQAVAMCPEAGFVCAVRGADETLVPQSGLLRLGGDGRGAAVSLVSPPSFKPAVGVTTVARGGRFKLVLTTPGLFDGGWRLPGLDDGLRWQGPAGCTAQLVCAAVPRAETVSGWDLANWQPKSAQRVAPTGSVYWFEDFRGEPAALGKLSETGLWDLPGQTDDPGRRTEGFNNVAVGSWK